MSDDNNNNTNNATAGAAAAAATTNSKAPLRIRSRFPKAQPNIGISSGINRIRRLSGHYNENDKPDEVVSLEKSDQLQRSNSIANNRNRNSTKLANADLNEKIVESQSPLPLPILNDSNGFEEKSINSNKMLVEQEEKEEVEKKIIVETVQAAAAAALLLIEDVESITTTNDRLLLNDLNEQQHPQEQELNQQLPSQQSINNYNPRFSKEHIMNIIKFKALQKLKKIESDVSR